MKSRSRTRPDVIEPFTLADVENWNQALASCEQARELCELGQQAGIPCDELLTECQVTRDRIVKLKQVFAPGIP